MAPKVAKEPKVGKKPAPKKVAGEKKGKEDGGAEKAPIAAVQKARKVQKKVVKGVHGTRVKKVRTSVKFYRPQTFRPTRAPKYPRKSTPARYGQSVLTHYTLNIWTLNSWALHK